MSGIILFNIIGGMILAMLSQQMQLTALFGHFPKAIFQNGRPQNHVLTISRVLVDVGL